MELLFVLIAIAVVAFIVGLWLIVPLVILQLRAIDKSKKEAYFLLQNETGDVSVIEKHIKILNGAKDDEGAKELVRKLTDLLASKKHAVSERDTRG